MLNLSYAQNQQINQSIFKIRASNCQIGDERALTGFIVEEGILTALHGVVGCTNIRALQYGVSAQVYTNLSIVKVDLDNDVALLQSPELLTQIGKNPELILPLSDNFTSSLEIRGFPLDLEELIINKTPIFRQVSVLGNLIPASEKANFQTCQSPSLFSSVLSIEATLLPGASGAPIFNTVNEVVGLGMGGLGEGYTEIVWGSIATELNLQAIEDIHKQLDERARIDCTNSRFSENNNNQRLLTQQLREYNQELARDNIRLEQILDRLLTELNTKDLEIEEKTEIINSLRDTLKRLGSTKNVRKQEAFNAIELGEIELGVNLLEAYILESLVKREQQDAILAQDLHDLALLQTITNPQKSYENLLKASQLNPSSLNILYRLGNIQSRFGDNEEAIISFEKILKIAQEQQLLEWQGAVSQSLGTLYSNIGLYEKAINIFQQGANAFQKSDYPHKVAELLSSIGNAYGILGDYDNAISYIEQAIELSVKIGDKRGEAQDLSALGTMYLNNGESEKAINYYTQALTISKEINNQAGQAAYLTNLGIAHMNNAQLSISHDYFEKALVKAIDLNNKLEEGKILSL